MWPCFFVNRLPRSRARRSPSDQPTAAPLAMATARFPSARRAGTPKPCPATGAGQWCKDAASPRTSWSCSTAPIYATPYRSVNMCAALRGHFPTSRRSPTWTALASHTRSRAATIAPRSRPPTRFRPPTLRPATRTRGAGPDAATFLWARISAFPPAPPRCPAPWRMPRADLPSLTRPGRPTCQPSLA